jgi:hypothetical protein
MFEKKNTYEVGVNNDLSNVVANVDINRVGLDKTVVEYSAPNFIIKAGSLIEANGNVYSVTSDESITAADGNLCFNESTGFFIDNVETPVYDPVRTGYYISNDRVTKHIVFSSGDINISLNRSCGDQSAEYKQLIDIDDYFSSIESGTTVFDSDDDAIGNKSTSFVTVANFYSPFRGTVNIYYERCVSDGATTAEIRILVDSVSQASETFSSPVFPSYSAASYDVPVSMGSVVKIQTRKVSGGSNEGPVIQNKRIRATPVAPTHYLWLYRNQ